MSNNAQIKNIHKGQNMQNTQEMKTNQEDQNMTKVIKKRNKKECKSQKFDIVLVNN